MSVTNPAEIASQFDTLRTRFKNMADDIAFDPIMRDLTDQTNAVAHLPDEIAHLRTRDYIFAKYLEHKADVLRDHWQDVAQQARVAIQTEIAALQPIYQQASQVIQKGEMASANPSALASLFPTLERTLGDVEDRARDAASRIRGVYTAIANDIQQTNTQITQLHWMLDQRDAASFSLLAGESLFLAAQAEWVATGKGGKDPDGIIYLTDQRLLFEQKETTGKTLGLFGGKKTQELEWEIPLNQIASVEPENKGMFGGKDMLNFALTAGARYPTLVVEVKGGVASKFWAAQIRRMIAGETDDERAIAPDPEVVEAIRNAPTACYVCGATLPRLVANQNQVTCRYCGAMVRF